MGYVCCVLTPTSAYQLYRRLVVALSDELNPEEIAQWPVMFKGDRGSFGQFSAINMPPTFLTLSVFENLRFFDPSKRDPKSNKTPTYNWPHFSVVGNACWVSQVTPYGGVMSRPLER